MDSGIELQQDPEPLERILNQETDILVFQDGRYLQNKCYTKRDAFVFMDCDEPKHWFAPQLQAGVIGFRNTSRSRKFVEEWLQYCLDPRILTDLPNQSGKPNWVDFIDHRHDQSILTNLVVRDNILPYRELSATGRNYSVHIEYEDGGRTSVADYRMAPSDYGVLSNPHKTRPPEPQTSYLQRAVVNIGRRLTRI
jgi:hypothetical protein